MPGSPTTRAPACRTGSRPARLRVVCATNAFGMGIDRPDIERVIHADIPGLDRGLLPGDRPGRTRRPAGRRDAALELRRREDPGVPDRSRPGALEPRRRFNSIRADVARRKEIEHKKLRRMVAYADSAGCLRATILRYFGDAAAREPCGACGNCARRAPTGDGGSIADSKRSCRASPGRANGTGGGRSRRCWSGTSTSSPRR